MFDLNRFYTRDEIHEKVGGSKQAFLPTNGNQVVCACLTPRLNPDAPGVPGAANVILVGSGPRIEATGERLSKQAEKIPIFLKEAPNRWRYVGDFRVVRSSRDPAEIRKWSRRANRENVRLLLFMTP